ncbi:hypothetical protein OG884_18685 [Streptosporangium sp. NBC_01755]|uniref:hypothetical protein n=1 Tax=unclassified Streptosporangium TaxID=2632669 RepID=UPI002DDAADE0|nr:MULTISPECIES: hypothetical protein [unclassified Streptosporangium]WSA23705.1 hypothetical protein OIE13_22450 [Streptosporangium sp. NBC_01810]WSD03835.1 hypothetical protein OG884_18685 [Streptosporangium sp. NBC_01755]
MTVLTPGSVREVAAWIKRWRPDDLVDVEVAPVPRITVQTTGRPLVYEADSIRRLTLR